MGQLIDIPVPHIGDFDTVEIIEIAVQPGDKVKPEDTLLTLESDKATMDIPSPAAGIVRELMVSVGDAVAQGALILKLEEDGFGGEAPADTGKPDAPTNHGGRTSSPSPDMAKSAGRPEKNATAGRPRGQTSSPSPDMAKSAGRPEKNATAGRPRGTDFKSVPGYGKVRRPARKNATAGRPRGTDFKSVPGSRQICPRFRTRSKTGAQDPERRTNHRHKCLIQGTCQARECVSLPGNWALTSAWSRVAVKKGAY